MSGLFGGLFTIKKANENCCGGDGKAAVADRTPAAADTQALAHIKLGGTALSANAFHIRRAEVLECVRRNPYEVHFKEIGGARAIAVARAPTPALNRVFGADLFDRDLVAKFNEWFTSIHAVPPYQLLGVGEHSAAAPAGFTRLPGWEHVILEKDDLEDYEERDLSSDTIAIEEIGKDDADTFVQIYAEAFDYPSAIAQPLCRSAELLIGEPDVITYVATVCGEPVSVGQLFLSAHGAAFLGSTGTLKSARRVGCQALLDRRRIRDAKKAGYTRLCRTVALESQSWRNALKVGFRSAFREDVYAPTALMPKVDVQAGQTGASGCCSTELAATAH